MFTQLRQAAVNRVKLKLSDYSELKKIFYVDENSERKLKRGFTVICGEGLPNKAECRKLGFNQKLTVSLVNRIPVRENDDVALIVDSLYADVQTIVTNFPNDTYLGLLGIRGVTVSSISKPQLFSNDLFLKVDINFNIDIKMDINYS